MDLTKYIAEGEQEFRAPGAEKPKGLASSPSYDAKLITWHLLYRTGIAPKKITSGRGHSYNVWTRGSQFSARISDYNDHRDGIDIITG